MRNSRHQNVLQSPAGSCIGDRGRRTHPKHTSVTLHERTDLVGGDGGFLLGQGELDVAGAGHVGVDATVGAVRAAALLHGLVHLDVADEQVVRVQALGLQQAWERCGGSVGSGARRGQESAGGTVSCTKPSAMGVTDTLVEKPVIWSVANYLTIPNCSLQQVCAFAERWIGVQLFYEAPRPSSPSH